MNVSQNAYAALVSKIDKQLANITSIHGTNIVCKGGCSFCCANLSVFPVEFHTIMEKTEKRNLSFDENAPCGFLDKNNLCTIYQERPIICRTHGLPIVFLNDEKEDPEYNVSFCDLNFQETDPYELEFDDENTVNIDEININLFRINEEFIREFKEKSYQSGERIPLRNLISQ